MNNLYLIGNFADQPRGKRLQKSLDATQSPEPLDQVGLSLASGQDYQSRTPAEQRKWLTWAARPGCTLLLVPPFQSAGTNEPNGWGVTSLESPPNFDHTSHSVLQLTKPEISTSITSGLARTKNLTIEAGTGPQLSGLFRKHPASGVFGVTTVPIWSLALADNVPALVEWLSAWQSLAGLPEEEAMPTSSLSFEPSQRHFSVLIYLASGDFQNRDAALTALEWNDTFALGDEDVPSLLDQLQAAGLTVGGKLTEAGRRALLESPYRPYAEPFLNPCSSI
jgi:hypothetical protein